MGRDGREDLTGRGIMNKGPGKKSMRGVWDQASSLGRVRGYAGRYGCRVGPGGQS